MSLFKAEHNHQHGGDCRRHAGEVITMVFIAAAATTMVTMVVIAAAVLLSLCPRLDFSSGDFACRNSVKSALEQFPLILRYTVALSNQ
jgi:hypothetical protein